MPRFTFHVHDGSARPACAEEMILPDAEAAWYQAVRSAREWLGGRSCTSGNPFIEIHDEDGYPLSAVPLDEAAGLAA